MIGFCAYILFVHEAPGLLIGKTVHWMPLGLSAVVFLITQSMAIFWRDSVGSHDLPQGVTVQAVKGFSEVDKVDVQCGVSFNALLNYVFQRSDLCIISLF